MHQAVSATIIPGIIANLETPLRRLFGRQRHSPAINADLTLISRRLAALSATAPTWHPLHLERVLERTVAVPLRAIGRSADRSTSLRVKAALHHLEGGPDALQGITLAAMALASRQ